MYNGLKADLYPVRPGDISRQTAFQRWQRIDFGPPIGNVIVHSLEDLILYKLVYYSISQQPKNIRDISAILHAKKHEPDLRYIEKWAEPLVVSTVWRELLEIPSV